MTGPSPARVRPTGLPVLLEADLVCRTDTGRSLDEEAGELLDLLRGCLPAAGASRP